MLDKQLKQFKTEARPHDNAYRIENIYRVFKKTDPPDFEMVILYNNHADS